MRQVIWALAVLGVVALASGVRAEEELVDNPVYKAWAQYKPGTFTTHQMKIVAGGMAMTQTLTSKLVSVAPEKAVVEKTMVMDMGGQQHTMPAQRVEIPAKVKKGEEYVAPTEGQKVEVSDAKTGRDTAEVKGKKLDAVTWEATVKSAGMTMKTKTWFCAEVPGGLVRMESAAEGANAMSTKMELLEYKVEK